jgi:hypothetical protein
VIHLQGKKNYLITTKVRTTTCNPQDAKITNNIPKAHVINGGKIQI